MYPTPWSIVVAGANREIRASDNTLIYTAGVVDEAELLNITYAVNSYSAMVAALVPDPDVVSDALRASGESSQPRNQSSNTPPFAGRHIRMNRRGRGAVFSAKSLRLPAAFGEQHGLGRPSHQVRHTTSVVRDGVVHHITIEDLRR